MSSRGLSYREWIFVAGADLNGRHSRRFFQAFFDAFKDGSLAVGMQCADDSHAGVGGMDGVVVADLASEKKFCSVPHGVVEHRAA